MLHYIGPSIFCLFFYASFGYVTFLGGTNFTNRILRENNAVKILFFGAIWPILLIVGMFVLLRKAEKRLYVDGKKLFQQPKLQIGPSKKLSLVEDPDYDKHAEYQPGKWMQN